MKLMLRAGLLQNYAWFNAGMCAWMTAMHSNAQNTPTIFITDPVTMADLELDKILHKFVVCCRPCIPIIA